jgi:phage shock protein C
MSMNERLYRSRDDRILAGVCGGLADRFDADPSLVRLACAAVWLLTGIVPVTVLYILAVIIVPEAPSGWPATPPPPDASVAPSAGTVPWPAEAGEPAFDAETTAPPPAGATPAGAAPAGDWYATQRADREAHRAARRAARAGRRADPLPAIIAGIVLLGLGAWLLLRDVVTIRWDIVWPVAAIALGAVLILIAVVPRSRGGSGGG